tara:strand:- start:121 stop:1569 length:1449 start_codon:yes stop_codon:yes gene_type:complete
VYKNIPQRLIYFLLLIFMLSTCTLDGNPDRKNSNSEWKNLFDGSSLDGWQQLGSIAQYHAENGVIVGTAKTGYDNSFLTTHKKYGDFILEFDVKIDPGLNSGVQFRSQNQDDDERVYGYQLEIDSSSRRWSGGIYDEGRKGWLYNLSRNSRARSAFSLSAWNRMRIEVIGTSIRSWVNGIPAADLIDDSTLDGFIGLQVQSIGDDVNKEGLQVRWTNIRIKTDDLNRFKTPDHNDIEQFSSLKNELTPREIKEGWQLLWDGQTTAGWKSAKKDGFPEKGWNIDNGVLSVLSSGGAEARNGGDIITTREFSSFELELDFRFTPGANSGIKYFVDPDLLKGKGSAIGLEFQILDDDRHPDAKRGISGNRTIGSLYDLITAVNQSEPQSPLKRVNPPGQWNRARIVVRGDYIEHWLNNILVVKYYRGTQMFRALVAYSKYAKWPNFGEWEKGPILLQDHGDLVSFRSIKIRDLTLNKDHLNVNET